MYNCTYVCILVCAFECAYAYLYELCVHMHEGKCTFRHVCVSMFVACAGAACTYMCICVKARDQNQVYSALVFETKSLSEPRAYRFR